MTWLYAIWRFIASSRIAQGIAAAGVAIAYYTLRIWQAKREGAREEREQAKIEAYQKRAEHSGDINTARQELDERQQERRDREREDDPRSRFGRDPFE